jgi:adenylate cyclase
MIEEASNFEVANLANIGSIYMEKQDYANALKYYDEALRVCEKGHHDDMLYAVLTELSTTHLKLKDNRKTLQYAVRGLDLSRKAEALNWMGNAQLNIGTALLQALQANEGDLTTDLPAAKSGRPLPVARAYLDSAVQAFTASGQKNMLKEAFHQISSLEEYEGNYRAALLHFKRFKEISDTVFNEGNREKVLQATLQHDFEQKEAVAKAAQDRKDLRQRVIRNSIAAGLLSVLIFAVVVFRQRNRISAEKKRSEDLLLNILPVEVAEELKVKGKAEAKHFDEVTMMFTDFRDFTLVAERMSPSELVNGIDLCFRAFDEIISSHGIEKIKTIGDAYMCAAGLPVANTTHASDMVKAAMEIRSFMQKHRETREAEGKHGFEIRIGIHTGPVVAGVVGTRKFAYDVWGDAVNTASRMESSGEAGQINISGSTFEKVRSEFRCRHRGKISAKNKGEIDMYFVEGSLA